MTDQVKYLVKYLGVIFDENLDWKAHLEKRMRKACIAYWQCRHAVGKTSVGVITEGDGLAIYFRGEAHSFVCFAGMVIESGAEKCSEKALSLATDDVRSTPTSALEVMLCCNPHIFS
jgi:hypothetical protein